MTSQPRLLPPSRGSQMPDAGQAGTSRPRRPVGSWLRWAWERRRGRDEALPLAGHGAGRPSRPSSGRPRAAARAPAFSRISFLLCAFGNSAKRNSRATTHPTEACRDAAGSTAEGSWRNQRRSYFEFHLVTTGYSQPCCSRMRSAKSIISFTAGSLNASFTASCKLCAAQRSISHPSKQRFVAWRFAALSATSPRTGTHGSAAVDAGEEYFGDFRVSHTGRSAALVVSFFADKEPQQDNDCRS
jgi:hypothetical protein